MTVLTVQEAAKFLKMSPSSIRRRLNEIPHYKVDKIVRFDRERLIEWMKSKEEGGSPEMMVTTQANGGDTNASDNDE